MAAVTFSGFSPGEPNDWAVAPTYGQDYGYTNFSQPGFWDDASGNILLYAVIEVAPTRTFTLTHQYRDNAVRAVNVTITDTDPAALSASADGTVLFRKKLSRLQFQRFMAEHPQCLVAMEACGGAHHWAREMERAGHEVRLIEPRCVKPFIKRQKCPSSGFLENLI